MAEEIVDEAGAVVWQTFRALVESADRKFAKVRDLPAYGRAHNHYFQKVFKAYMRLWKYQQENRRVLVAAGLKRWEIGEIASRIGQLYFNQYMRSSEARFLVEAFVFYDAILHRRYFDGAQAKDLGVRFKELRFYARFLLVSVILNRHETVQQLVEMFGALVDDCKSKFREASFKEWKLVVQEILRFMEVDTAFKSSRPVRYCVLFDLYPASRPYVARFHAKKVLKFTDAILTSYHRNEVKFAELTLDTYRMLQFLEWEPSGSFYQKQPIESAAGKRPVESHENGFAVDHSAVSGMIDMNLAADQIDSDLPPNPRKAVLYRPSVTHLLAVMATICEELPPESVMLIYLSASGKSNQSSVPGMNSHTGSRKPSKSKAVSSTTFAEQNNSKAECHSNGKAETSGYYYNDYIWLGPKGNGGPNVLYPGDIIPFTRKPLFMIVDSGDSHAFKAAACLFKYIKCLLSPEFQVLHGAERGEPVALMLSPLRSLFKNSSATRTLIHNGSQFTFFLTSPLQAFCQMVGLNTSDIDTDEYNSAEEILATAFSELEVILCTSRNLDIVWAQVVLDPFMRRIILRFILCRAVMLFFSPPNHIDECTPVCVPELPSSVSAGSDIVRSAVLRLADQLNVVECFRFDNSTVGK
ncbi:Protein SCAI [Linum grandiflorum]